MEKIKHQHSRLLKLFTIIKGFTLVELLVVIAIIGILASVVITSFQFILVRAQDSRNKALADSVGTAIVQYGVDHNNNYPIASTDGGVDLPTLENNLIGYLKTNAALTQATGVAKYMSSADGSSFAAVWELKYTNDPTVTTSNGVYATNAANLAGAVNVPGVLGNAINFGGGQTQATPPVNPTSTVTIPHNGAMNFDSNFTASLWFRAEPWATTPEKSYLVTKYEETRLNVPFYFYLNNVDLTRPNKWAPTLYRGNILSPNITIQSSKIITDGDGWHNLVAIKNGGNIYLVIDGDNIAMLPDVINPTANLGPIKVGPVGLTGNPYYNGDIDDFRIYNTALTTGAGSQVEALYNAGKGSAINPLISNTIGYWRFDEGSGATLKNLGSSTLVNPTTLIDGTLSNIASYTWTKGIIPRFGFTGIGSSLLGKAFVVYGPQ